MRVVVRAACLLVILLASSTTGVRAGAPRCAVYEALARDALQKHSVIVKTPLNATVPFTLAETRDTKHSPYTIIANGYATITVGVGTVTKGGDQLIHPTTPSADPNKVHYIERIFAKDQDGVVLAVAELTASTDRPTLKFAVPKGTTTVTPYSLCNIHGLWEGPRIDVPPADAQGSATCTLARCGVNAVGVVDGVCLQYAALEGNAIWWHRALIGTATPFNIETYPNAYATNHSPHVAILGSRARVTIGRGTVTHSPDDLIHVQFPGDTTWPEKAVHYIPVIYAKDQNGRVIAAGMYLPTGERPVLEFAIPAGTTAVTAYALCNLRGLYEGMAVAVAPAQTDLQLTGVPCGVVSCGGYMHAAPCPMFDAFRVDAVRKHHAQVGANTTVFTPTPENTKHTPYVTIRPITSTDGGGGAVVTVTVGLGTVSGNPDDYIHPTDPEKPHFIELLYVVDQRDQVVAMAQLTASTPRPELTFNLPAGVTEITAYSLCNLHGLYAGAPTDVLVPGTAGAACALMDACETTLPASDCTQLEALAAEAERLQLAHFGETVAFTPSAAKLSVKHTPHITITGTSAVVTVDLGCQTQTTDAAPAQYIDVIYVKNEAGAVIAMAKLAPVNDVPSLSFAIPEGTVQMTAYVMCNVHGLYMSDVVDVPAASRGAGPAVCRLARCGGAPSGYAACGVFDSLRADALRLHQLVHKRGDPFGAGEDAVHAPVVAVDADTGEATVTVPNFIPQLIPTRPGDLRFIRRIYVENQFGVVLAMGEYLAAAVPSLTFSIPTGTRLLRAYVARNAGGVTQSAPVDVTRTGGAPRVCRVTAGCDTTTTVLPADATQCAVFGVIRNHMHQQHEILHGSTEAFAPNDDNLKHTPFITVEGSFATVTVGAGTVGAGPIHPMAPSGSTAEVHYIEAMYVVDQAGAVVAATALVPEDAAELTLEIPQGTTTLTAYAWCNKHGLYAGVPASVSEAAWSSRAATRCGLARCGGAAQGVAVCPKFEALRANALQQHRLFRPSDDVYAPTPARTKHIPYISVVDGAARVNVGVGHVTHAPEDLIHTGRVTMDPANVHMISRLWVANQHDVVVAMAALPAHLANTPTLTFDIPEGTTQLTAYSLCNPHGLYSGYPVNVADVGGAKPGAAKTCGLRACATDPVGYDDATGICREFELLKAEVRSLHLRRHGDVDQGPLTTLSDETPLLEVRDGQGYVRLSPAALALRSPSSNVDFHRTFDAIYVEDQSGRVVAAGRFAPTDDVALTFAFANTTTSLTPFVSSTATGVHEGAAVVLAANPHCFTQGCALPDGATTVNVTSPKCFFNTLRAESQRRHELMHPASKPAFPPGGDTKHQPYITIADGRAVVTVGLGTVTGNPDDKIHPTTATSDPLKVHFIERMYVVDQNDVVIAMTELSGTGARPVLDFAIPLGTTAMTAYALCNVHGLYASDVYGVAPADIRSETTSPTCTLAASCAEDTVGVVDNVCMQHAVLAANSVHMQLAYFDSDTPFTFADSAKHTPYIAVAGVRGRVTVGLGTSTGSPADLVHGNTNSTDPDIVHFIELMYVKDQDGLVVAMKRLHGEDNVLEFAIPPTATRLTPYAHCNVHGLYVGAAVDVATTVCTLQGCADAAAVAQTGTGTIVPTPGTVAPAGPEGCTPSDLEGYACMSAVAIDGVALHWTWDGVAPTIDMAVESKGSRGWLAIAFTETFGSMIPADAVVFSESGVDTYRLTRQGASGVNLDASVVDRIGLAGAAGETVDTTTVLRFTRNANGFDALSGINYARDLEQTRFGVHDGDQVAATVVRLTGATEVEVVEIVDLQYYRQVHGWLMLVAWCYLAPIGVLIKRYGKKVLGMGNAISPRAGFGSGFVAHILLVLAAVASSMSAFALARANFRANAEPDPDAHNTVGYAVFGCVCAMPCLGILMPIFYPTGGNLGRAVLQALHANLGRCLLIAAYYQIFTGIRKLRAFETEGAALMEVFAICGVAIVVVLAAVFEYMQRNYRVSRLRPAGKGIRIERVPWSQIMSHGSADEPWIVIDGKVYDVSVWLNTHPGGPAVLLSFAGEDGSDTFRNVGHSVQAMQRMERYFVGDVEDNRMVTVEDLATKVTASLVCLQLQDADEALEEHRALLPESLHASFRQLVQNLEHYIPFLPPSLVAEVQCEDDEIEVDMDADEWSSVGNEREREPDSPRGGSGVQDAAAAFAASTTTATGASLPKVTISEASSHGSQASMNTSRRGSRRVSAVPSVQRAKRASIVASRGNAIKRQRISLVYITAHFNDNLSDIDIASFPKYHEFFLNTVSDAVHSSCGVVDSFSGNRAVAAWNAFRTSPTHPVRSVNAITVFLNEAPRFRSVMACTASGASGQAMIGTLGTTEMRRPAILGDIVNIVHGLEKYCIMSGVTAVTNAECYEDAKLQHTMRIIMDKVYFEEAMSYRDPRRLVAAEALEKLRCPLGNKKISSMRMKNKSSFRTPKLMHRSSAAAVAESAPVSSQQGTPNVSPQQLGVPAAGDATTPTPSTGRPSKPPITLIYEVVLTSDVAVTDRSDFADAFSGEWMYQLDSAACRVWESYNECGKLALWQGKVDLAIERLNSRKPEQVECFREALGEACTFNFCTRITNAQGDAATSCDAS